MKVIEINKTSTLKDSFDKYISKTASVFYLSEWLDIYKNRSLQQCAIVNNNNDVIGSFQYLRFKKAIFDCVITPPFMPSIALQYINPAESIVGKNSFDKEVLQEVANYFANLKVDLIDIALPVSCNDTQPFTWKGFKSQLRYTYHLPMHLSQEDLWNRLSSEKRKSISRAEKDGLQIIECKDYQAAKAMVIDTLKRNKALANQDLIEQIISEKHAAHLKIFGAYENNRLLAVSVCIVQADSFIYLFGGTAAEDRHHGAGVSCMWNSILAAKAGGKTIFDFEGSMQPGIERYFREFGGDLIKYAAITKKRLLIDLLMRVK